MASKYAVCYGGWPPDQQVEQSRLLALLPPAARDLLGDAPLRQGPLFGEPGNFRPTYEYCADMTTDEARAVAVALDDAGFHEDGASRLNYRIEAPGSNPGEASRVVRAVPPARRDHVLGVRMTVRRILFGALLASVVLSSVAAAGPEASSLPPPVGRIAKELAGGGAKRVIVFASAGGKSYVATAGTRRPKADQRFRVGSVTKTFTATLVLQLVDEGKLGLGGKLEDYLPGVIPRGEEITVRQLLQHRSGLVNYTDFTSWLKGPSRSGSIRPIDFVRFAGSKPLAFDPGTQWSYSNTNYIALGLVIEKVTGRSYADELEQRIFRPLGLDDTELPQTRLLPDLGDDTELSQFPGAPKGDPIYDVDWANPAVSWAAGGIVSNARDLSRYYSALLSGRILSGNSLAAMKKTVAAGSAGAYGLGIVSIGVRCGRSWGHGGGILDYGTLALASDKGDRTGVISVYGAGVRHTARRERTRVFRVPTRGIRGNAGHRLPPRG